jgi:hypothetical protein
VRSPCGDDEPKGDERWAPKRRTMASSGALNRAESHMRRAHPAHVSAYAGHPMSVRTNELVHRVIGVTGWFWMSYDPASSDGAPCSSQLRNTSDRWASFQSARTSRAMARIGPLTTP